MKDIRKRLKPISIMVTVLVLMLSLPYQTAIAALIGTQDLVASQKASEARVYITSVVAREDIQQLLMARGIDPIETQARVNALTDQEAIQIAETMKQLPAGGSVVYIVGLAVFVFLVLLVTDLLGYTDIFPFVKKTVNE